MAKMPLLLAVSLALGGCNMTRPLFLVGDLREEATKAADDYSTNLRWGRLSEAVELVEPVRRSEFIAFFAEGHRYRFTDASVALVDYDAETLSALATVRFMLYTVPMVREIQVVETQRWRFDRKADAWYVDPDLEAFRRLR